MKNIEAIKSTNQRKSFLTILKAANDVESSCSEEQKMEEPGIESQEVKEDNVILEENPNEDFHMF